MIDYVAKPKPTGYRAMHVVVQQHDRLVEIQLRTYRQNVWADEVERWADALGFEPSDRRRSGSSGDQSVRRGVQSVRPPVRSQLAYGGIGVV